MSCPLSIDLPPYYLIRSAVESSTFTVESPTTLLVAPGKGFGDGRHETTQLCLLAMGYLLRSQVKPKKMLDFGAGNGILGIAAAKAGATVEAVEIDGMVLDEARNNAALNGVAAQFDFRQVMSEPAQECELVVANILCQVLLEYASALVARVSRRGYLVLSGLTSTDVPAILSCYRQRLPDHRAASYERGSWRAVVFSPCAQE